MEHFRLNPLLVDGAITTGKLFLKWDLTAIVEGLSIISTGWVEITPTTEEVVQTYTVSENTNYYFYVNGKLVVTGEDLASEKGAVGVFSFNSVMTLENYKVVKSGQEYDVLLDKAKEDVEELYAFKLTTNYFTEGNLRISLCSQSICL